MTPEELERQLQEEAQAIIEAIVKDYRKDGQQTISQIEAAAVQAGQDIKQKVLDKLAAANSRPAQLEHCPACGGGLVNKGQRSKWVVTQAGQVQLKRTYYYCAACQRGFFPR